MGCVCLKPTSRRRNYLSSGAFVHSAFLATGTTMDGSVTRFKGNCSRGSSEKAQVVPSTGLRKPDSGSRVSELMRTSPSSVSLKASVSKFADPSQTLIVFDWDDTLFPTSALRVSSFASLRRTNGAVRLSKSFSEYSRMFRDLIVLASSLGHVAIITIAARGWVESCMTEYLNDCVNLIFSSSSSCIDVLYAKDLSSDVRLHSQSLIPALNVTDDDNIYQLHVAEKAIAFKKVIETFYSRYPQQSWKNIISIGDSSFERDAVQEVTFLHEQPSWKPCRTKVVKLMENPNIENVVRQMEVLCTLLPLIVGYDEDVDTDLNLTDNASIQKALDMLSIDT